MSIVAAQPIASDMITDGGRSASQFPWDGLDTASMAIRPTPEAAHADASWSWSLFAVVDASAVGIRALTRVMWISWKEYTPVMLGK